VLLPRTEPYPPTFHILGEALQIAIEHSGSRHVQSLNSDEIHPVVNDAGMGIDSQALLSGSTLGLTVMEERLKMVNGELSIESHHDAPPIRHISRPITMFVA